MNIDADVESRILVLAPTDKDARLTKAMLLRAGMSSVCCRSLDDLCNRLETAAAAILVPEEAIVEEPMHPRLAHWLLSQPPWSDLPILILARHGADSPALARAMERFGNVIVLERPTRVAALVSAARAALRARQRQYQIREHLEERERAAAELLANDRRKDEFLAILAHELRNPLAPISNSLQVLRMLESDQPALTQVTDMMHRQVAHMVRLVDDLLEVSRITRGKIELRKETVELAAVIRTALESSGPAIESAGHHLEISMPPEAILLDADPVRMAQVISNLINNAAKYTDPGGRIRLDVRRVGGEAEISVRDNGKGIPASMLARVFDLFTQVVSDSARTHGGLGIGLTLVRRLVELHGGTVTASSDGPGTGSTFVVRLPAITQSSSSPGESVADELPAGLPRHKVLVVDDNHDAADSLGELLSLLGADVRVVYSGAEALGLLASFRPGVMLLDIGMAGMDGHELARNVRKLPGFSDVKLIAMTGWGQEEDRRRTREAGFDYHLTKPADASMLSSLLVELGQPLARAAQSHPRRAASQPSA